ncbi:hypothetical protein F4808DRAFT_475459 [Astrocystis sublimbata]|nr:hypothetical protein F4808DRAFT_475459 [Astrocystis sublimbata]
MDSGVYIGTWTNWSRGPVFGRTLTITRESGNPLIAFTAVFVGFVASRFWRIVCLCLHRCYSTSQPRETTHHQRQIILRNSTAPEAALWTTLTLLWAWRKLPNRKLAGFLPTLLLAVICIAAFTAASGFSSSISTAVGDEVLISAPNCAIPDGGDGSDSTLTYSDVSGKLNDAANYAQQCYEDNENKNITGACNKFARTALKTSSASYNASCPFDNKICRNQDSNVRLDTGYIGNDELGLNLPAGLGFGWRYVLHCAPLETEGYTDHVVDEQGIGHARFYYGGNLVGPIDNQTVEEYLYDVEDSDYQYPRGGRHLLSGSNYRVSFAESVRAQGQVLPGFAKLIPELTRLDGDTTLVFLSGNGVVFSERMDDDWYRATQRAPDLYTLAGKGYHPSYIPEIASSPMGCVEQWQWCDSASPSDESHCGPLASLFDSFYGAGPLFNVSEEEFASPPRPSSPDKSKARFLWPAQILQQNPTILAQLIGFLGAKSLKSQAQLLNVQWPIPRNQWQLDVTWWWHTILASVQASCRIHRPRLRIIRSSEHTSFSLFGLLFAFVTGAVIIIVAYALEPLLNCFYRYKKYRPYAHFEWMTNGSLQLHRLAHEELGLQTWSSCTDDIPITKPDVFLAGIDFTDPEHPVLSAQGDIKDYQRSDPEQESVSSTNEPRLLLPLDFQNITEITINAEEIGSNRPSVSSVSSEGSEVNLANHGHNDQIPAHDDQTNRTTATTTHDSGS